MGGGLPVTRTWNEPVGVPEAVDTVSILEPVGVTEGGLNPHEVPEGSVEGSQDKTTASGVPLFKVAKIVLVPELPGGTVMPPEFDKL